MNRVFTVSLEDMNQLEKLSKDLAVASEKDGTLWPCQLALLTFLDRHPTILSYCAQAGREKKRAQVLEDQGVAPFQTLHAGGRP